MRKQGDNSVDGPYLTSLVNYKFHNALPSVSAMINSSLTKAQLQYFSIIIEALSIFYCFRNLPATHVEPEANKPDGIYFAPKVCYCLLARFLIQTIKKQPTFFLWTAIVLIIFPLSDSGHHDKYLYEMGRRSKIPWFFILRFLARRTATLFDKEKCVKFFHIFAVIWVL